MFVRGWISHLEAMWENPRTRSFFSALAERFTVIRYDTRGQGVSDREVEPIDLDALTVDLQALMDTLGLEDVVLYGQTFGGPIAISYAARHPYRVGRLVLDGTYAKLHVADPEAHESFVQTLERLWPHSISLIAQLTSPDPSGASTIDPQKDWSTRALTAQMAGHLYRLAAVIDVRELLPALAMPALVMHRRGSQSIPRRAARELAAELPNASLVMLEGSAHNPWDENPQEVLDAIGEFLDVELRLRGGEAETAPPMAILFTDIEASTAFTSNFGDARGHELVRVHDAAVREALKTHGGTEVKHTGDGIMASFPSISGAVECGIEIQRQLGLREAPFGVKIGMDAGEPLRQGSNLTGTVVQSARRIVDRAEAGQILVSDVVRRLVAGKRFVFVDRGRAALRGLPERIRLFEVVWRPPADSTDLP